MGKWRKRKMTFPKVDPTLLKDTAGLDSIRALSDDKLQLALASAGTVEGWALSIVKGLEKTSPDDPLIEPFVAAAMHSRIARECMAIELVLRDEGKGHAPGPGGPDDTPPLGKNGKDGKAGYI